MARPAGVRTGQKWPAKPPNNKQASPAEPLYYHTWSVYGPPTECVTGHFWRFEMRKPECIYPYMYCIYICYNLLAVPHWTHIHDRKAAFVREVEACVHTWMYTATNERVHDDRWSHLCVNISLVLRFPR